MNSSSIRALRFPWRQHWRYLVKPAIREFAHHLSASIPPAVVVGLAFVLSVVSPHTPWQDLCPLMLIGAVPTYVLVLIYKVTGALNTNDFERHWTAIARLYRRLRTAGTALSAEALRRVAYHEVGHLIVYSSLSPVKGTLDMEIVDDTDWEHLGVASVGLAGLHTRERLYRRCASKIAGRLCAEHFVGYGFDGAASDEAEWIELAKEYLTEYRPHGIFYPRPVRGEVEYNNEQLAQLRSRQEAELVKLFDANREWIGTMADRLIIERHLTSDTLEAALEHVQWKGILTS
jgi:hypothetical protein